jgi:hypothetical protein
MRRFIIVAAVLAALILILPQDERPEMDAMEWFPHCKFADSDLEFGVMPW